ncbi:type II CAAX endopeptidase family protein [Acetivibrio clariflavus]|uniref:Putative metal-dependent membrane protease n=1 Tax=Acetivibrio clariflavus (strain DSM 19732 / NBRC 101661 / EBR45) TaxID=720554 RepID=G8LZF1_ACECE|nr:type II CAAX endopeptidase family protein [Acetivibrio clariflavus]AEV66814.1 putative metal-dependent membrane protease [Acetivibrio clariflavus DSM 19732]
MEEKPRINNDNLELINEKKDYFRKPSLWQVGALFSFVVIIFLYLGARLQKWNVNYGLFLSEVGLIFLPPVLFLIIFKFDVKKVLRINKPGFLNLILIFGIMIFSLPVIGVLNLLNFWIIKQIFGRYEIFQVPLSTESWGLLVGILIIGVLAGICEETLFRGVIQRGLERFGAAKSILITAVLFGLMHMDFQRFLGTFLLGALFGYLTYKSNSIFSSMFAHFANNSIAVCLMYASLKANEFLKQSGVNGIDSVEKISNGDIFETLASMSRIEIIGFIVVYAIIFCFSAIWLYLLLRFFAKHNSNRETEVPRDERPIPVRQLVSFIPGLLLILFYDVIDILRMGNIIDQSTMEQILRSIGL